MSEPARTRQELREVIADEISMVPFSHLSDASKQDYLRRADKVIEAVHNESLMSDGLRKSVSSAVMEIQFLWRKAQIQLWIDYDNRRFEWSWQWL